MKVTINGKITNVLPEKRGVSSRGNAWVSQDFVIECEDGDKLVFNVFGEDTIKQYNLAVGTKASVTVEIASREFNGKWFTSAKCVECFSNSAPKESAPVQEQAPIAPPRPEVKQNVSSDDLPF